MNYHLLLGIGLGNNERHKPDSTQQPPHDKARKLGSENVDGSMTQRNQAIKKLTDDRWKLS
jgi:hypothetical protein